MKVLLPETRELCYFSGSFFLDRMEEALEERGIEAVRLSLSMDSSGITGEEGLKQLEECLSDRFDAVIDINSELPYLVMEDNEPYLNRMGAPFFNYILDHPLYHHPGLSFNIKDYHAIAIDRAHKAYMEKYYPNIRTVTYLPVAGTEPFIRKEEGERRIPLLFTGTYLPERVPFSELAALGEETESLGMTLTEEWDPVKEPMEDALERLIISRGEEVQKKDFPVLMNRLYPVDRIMRNRLRLRVLRKVAKSGVEIVIYGEGWEETDLRGYANVTLKEAVTIGRTFDIMGDSEAVLDINPLFTAGIHDRVTSTLACSALSVTTMSKTADPGLKDKEHVIYMDPSNEDSIEEALMTYQSLTPAGRKEISMAGHEAYKHRYSWAHHAKMLEDVICQNNQTIKNK